MGSSPVHANLAGTPVVRSCHAFAPMRLVLEESSATGDYVRSVRIPPIPEVKTAIH